MKKVVLTENQYSLLKEFFEKKNIDTLKNLAEKMTKLSIEFDFNSDFGLQAYIENDDLIISIDSNLSKPYRRALSSVSLLNSEETLDFVDGNKNTLPICNKEQAISEGKYILMDFKEVLKLIKGDLDVI